MRAQRVPTKGTHHANSPVRDPAAMDLTEQQRFAAQQRLVYRGAPPPHESQTPVMPMGALPPGMHAVVGPPPANWPHVGPRPGEPPGWPAPRMSNQQQLQQQLVSRQLEQHAHAYAPALHQPQIIVVPAPGATTAPVVAAPTGVDASAALADAMNQNAAPPAAAAPAGAASDKKSSDEYSPRWREQAQLALVRTPFYFARMGRAMLHPNLRMACRPARAGAAVSAQHAARVGDPKPQTSPRLRDDLAAAAPCAPLAWHRPSLTRAGGGPHALHGWLLPAAAAAHGPDGCVFRRRRRPCRRPA